MDNKNEILIEYLKQNNQAIDELLRVTKLVTLTAKQDKIEEEAEDYIFLIEKRNRMLEDISLLNENIQKLKQQLTINTQEKNNIAQYDDYFKAKVKEILKIDKENNTKANIIFSHIKKSIRGINMGKTINNAYQNDSFFSMGSLCDVKN